MTPHELGQVRRLIENAQQDAALLSRLAERADRETARLLNQAARSLQDAVTPLEVVHREATA